MLWMRLVGVVLVVATAASAGEDACLTALRATVRLHGNGQSATAFAVAVPAEGEQPAAVVLVSAAHSFDGLEGATATVTLRAPEGPGWRRQDVAVAIRTAAQPLWVRHPSADLAVLPWTIPPGVDLQPFPLPAIATAAHFDASQVRVGQRVRVACYPAQTEANNAGWPVLRTGTIASHPLTPAAGLKRFFVDYSHYGGDSGAAVVVDDGPEAPVVAGVVVAMQRQTDRVTSPFEEKTVHTPLGLAITLPATLLHETIAAWKAASPPAR